MKQAVEQVHAIAEGSSTAAIARPSRPILAEAPVTGTGTGAARRARPSMLSWPFRRVANALVALAALFLAFVVACAVAPQLVAPFAPTDMHAAAILSEPGGAYWFGTDQFGRDVFSLVVYGARQSMLIGVSAVLLGSSLGVSVGLLAGYAGGWIDMLLMRIIDVWMAIPSILLAIALSASLRPSLFTTIVAVSVAAIPRYARVVRGLALAVRRRPFVEAARASGASHFAILRGHVLPQCFAPILVLATLGIGGSILVGSGLSFLGLGVNDERPDWGYLLTQGRGYLSVAWWTVTYPGLFLTALVISVNLLGDALHKTMSRQRTLRR